MIKGRLTNNVKPTKTYPAGDINSDHNPVTMKMKVKLKYSDQSKKYKT